jgi:hypothetical protein
MQTLLVDLILAAAVGAVFLIALRGRKIGWENGSLGSLADFFNLFWGWADYAPQDWSNAPYKREYSARRGNSVSYRSAQGSPYRSGRSPLWVKVKNPNAPAVRREAKEDWGR